MRVGGRPGPAKMQTSPPADSKHQESAGLRLSPTYILCILWRASLVNHSILLIQTIRELRLLPATPCSLACRPSRPPPGNDDQLTLCLSYSCFCTNPLTFSVQVKPSKRAKKNKPAEEPVLTEPDASTMSRRLHQLLKPPLLHLMNKLWKVLITRRSPTRLIQMIQTL